MAKKKSPIDFGDIWNGDNESKRKANAVLEKMGMPSDYKLQYVAEKDMKGQAQKAVKAKKQRNMYAIRDSGQKSFRTTRVGVTEKDGSYVESGRGNQYFGETKKKTKRPTVKKK